MHKQECGGERKVTGLKGIRGQAILPFLETDAKQKWISVV